MTFFYDLNKKLQQVLDTPKSEHKQLNERAETDESALQAYLGKKKYGEAGMKALQKAGREGKDLAPVRAKYDKMDEASTGDYSAKKARAGKDIGKPGKAFASIAKDAGKRYGSKAAGERVAGAVLNKLRHPKESVEDRLKDLDQSNPVNQPAYQRKAKSGDSAAAARGMPNKKGMDEAIRIFAKPEGSANTQHSYVSKDKETYKWPHGKKHRKDTADMARALRQGGNKLSIGRTTSYPSGQRDIGTDPSAIGVTPRRIDKKLPMEQGVSEEGVEDRLKDLDQSNPVNQPAYQRKAKSGDSAAAARGMPNKKDKLDELSPATLTSYAGKRAGQGTWAGGVAKGLAGRPQERSGYADSHWTDPKVNYGPEGDQYAKFNQKALGNIKKAISKGATPNNQRYDWEKQGGYGDASNPVTRQRGVAEATANPQDQVKAVYIKAIDKYFGAIYDYGDSGFEILDSMAPTWGKLFDKYGSDFDTMVAKAPQRLIQKAITELKDAAEYCEFHLEPGEDDDVFETGGVPMTAKQKSFAALAPPKDKITFADKIAGAKKEVDEMLGDVAAEAIKSALSPKQKKLDLNKNGKLDANDFAMLRAGKGKQETDEGWEEMEKDVKRRMGPKVGDVKRGARHDIETTATGIKATRRYDDDEQDNDTPQGEKRGRGRPKRADGPRQERVTAKSRKADRTAYTKKKTTEGDFGPMEEGADEGSDMVKLAKVIQSCRTMDQLETARKMAQNFLKKHATNDIAFYGPDAMRRADVVSDVNRKKKELQGGEELDEKAVSKKQQRFMGMVHATQKGEKAPSKEVAKVAKTMKKKDAEDFASTKHKGLPEKKKADSKKDDSKGEDKPKKVKEQGGVDTPTASSGFSYGKGIYDSINHELESMIAESMNISMSMNSDAQGGPSKTITVSATDDDAIKLGELLKNAGLGGDHAPNIEGGADVDHPGAIEVHGTMDADGAEGLADKIRQAMGDHEHGADEPCPDCGSTDCGCDHEEVDEAAVDVSNNQPNWPTNTETSNDAFQYSGGLNKPKTDVAGDGQTTIPNTAVHTQAEDELRRLREMAGIKEGAKPDFPDVDNDGDEKETIEKALKDKAEKKVDEGILSATANLWQEYKGKYGV